MHLFCSNVPFKRLFKTYLLLIKLLFCVVLIQTQLLGQIPLKQDSTRIQHEVSFSIRHINSNHSLPSCWISEYK